MARAGGVVVSRPIAGSAPCDARVDFDIDGGVLRVSVGSSSTETRLERGAQPIVTALHAHPDVAGTELSARIVTQPAGSSPSRRQLLAMVGGIGCVLAAALLLLRAARGPVASGARALPVASGAGRALPVASGACRPPVDWPWLPTPVWP